MKSTNPNGSIVISLPIYNILITIGSVVKGGRIQSDLRGAFDVDPNDGRKNTDKLLGVIAAIESLILAHAVAGIDVDSPAYLEGIETTIDTVANNIH